VEEEENQVGLFVEVAGGDRFPAIIGEGKTRSREAVVLFVKADV
jgi:hypothetical protein